ncbi:MAG TPA: hypothetical protein VG755_17585 [Nannocystaceae bacterium]|nr:hypothetical protein [Nannocystaceae bacterium]
MRRALFCLGTIVGLSSATARADDFAAGSIIIPMDLDYQDEGMFRAYGLVYELLRNHIPVRWVIASGKEIADPDFTVSATDVASGDAVPSHGYRGGPWVVDSVDADAAMDVVAAWQLAYPETVVHVADDDFTGEVSRYLVVAPTIAMHADGNEDIARQYMEAAAIPDSTMDYTWPNASPDMIEPEELAGPTDADHADGQLFDEDGDAVYCQFMSMHWGVNEAAMIPEAVAEVRQFLNSPTHFFAECQAVSAFENTAPHGFFLTPNGLDFADQPMGVDYHNSDSPFAQLDGAFETVGGSEPAYALPAGDAYKAGGVVMMTATGAAEGEQDLWMTGYLDGACPPEALECGSFGKVSYLGGHRYMTDTPISAHGDSQGARLFLNALFEAPCATLIGLPTINLAVGAPELVIEPEVTFELAYANAGEVTALGAFLIDPLPTGTTFLSASDGGMLIGGDVVWDLGNLGPGEGADVSYSVTLADPGQYDNAARLEYRVGLNQFVLDSNVSQTIYDPDGTLDSSGSDGGTSSGSGGGSSASGSAGTSTSVGGSTSTASSDDTSGGSGGGGEDMVDGCGCNERGASTGWLALLVLPLLRRRRLLAVLATAACSAGEEMPYGEEVTGSSGIGSITAPTSVGEAEETGPKLDIVGSQDLLEQHGCAKIDFLFVIDSSESMTVHQENLVNSFPGFVTAMQDAVNTDDWHVMVVDTDAQWNGSACAGACTTLGTCPDEPAFACDTPPPDLCDIAIGAGIVAPYGQAASNAVCEIGGDGRYIDASTPDFATSFACAATVGVDGNSEERTAEALVTSIDAELTAADGCNSGFLRDDAILVITIITDEADHDSAGTPPEWFEAIVAAKHDDPSALVVLGLLPDADAATPLCDDDDEGGVVAELVASFPASSRASVCEADYSPFLADAVGVIADTCADFVPPG